MRTKLKVRRKGIVIPNRREAEKAWRKAETLAGFDPDLFRISGDGLQAMIRRDRLNNRRPFGWTVRDGKAICYGDLSVLTALSEPRREPQREARSRSQAERRDPLH